MILEGPPRTFGGGVSVPWISSLIFAGVRGTTISCFPNASETAFAKQTGVDMQLPSAAPLAPKGVKGDGVSMCKTTGSGTSTAVGTR